jgi:hypothetical protein
VIRLEPLRVADAAEMVQVLAARIGLTPTGRISEGEQMWLALPAD